MARVTFKQKEEGLEDVQFSPDEVQEIIPDADMRFSLVMLKNGEKHFIQGSKPEIQAALDEL